MSLADDVAKVRLWLSYCVLNPQPHGTPCAEVTRIVDAISAVDQQAKRRDEFARAALTGLLANPNGEPSIARSADIAWRLADAMLVAEKGRP